MNQEKAQYDRAVTTLRVHGIISIVFGGLGVLTTLLFGLMIAIGSALGGAFDGYNEAAVGLFFLGALVFVFWTLPHIYLLVSGVYLIREPSVKVAKTLIIINLIVGVFWNLVILVFSIINLTELADYERGKHAHHKHPHNKKD